MEIETMSPFKNILSLGSTMLEVPPVLPRLRIESSSGGRMIGLKPYTVRVVDRHSSWMKLAADACREVQLVAGDLLADLQHVGSTAVPGLPAKPILDLAAGMRSLEAIPELIKRLTDIGFIYRGNAEDDGGHIFVKESPPDIRTLHLHVVEYNGNQWKDYLLFRELLRQDRQLRNQYAELKRRLAEKPGNVQKGYTAAKGNFIRGVLNNCTKTRSCASPSGAWAYHNRAGFTIIELLVVISIVVVLAAMTASTLSVNKGTEVTRAGNTISDLSRLARQHALSKNTRTVLVVAQVTAGGIPRSAVSIWDASTTNQLEKWNLLPDAVFATNTTGVSSSYTLPCKFRGAAVTGDYYVFHPDGRMNDDLVQAPRLSVRPRQGNSANVYELVFSPLTGTFKVSHP